MFELIVLLVLFLFLGGLFLLANLADAQREKGESGTLFAGLAYGVVIVIYLCALFGGLLAWVGLTMVQSNPEIVQEALSNGQFGTGLANPLAGLESPLLFGLGLAVPAFVGLLLLLPWVRRIFARFTNINARSSVHALALSLSMLVIMQIGVLLGMGMQNLAEAASQSNSSSAMQLATLWVQQLSSAALGIVGVGFLVRRNWSETLTRLGLVVPTFRQVTIGVGAAFALVIMVIVLGSVASQFGIGFDKNVEKLTEKLMGVLFESPWGILTAGLSAAIGEEILIRGALQPRFGILFSTILFALLHGQYGLTFSTLIVFLVGLVLGVIRNRENTSTSMIVHATYNMLLSTMTYLGVEFLSQ